jgi:cob(I)alamin adenosyltransferase
MAGRNGEEGILVSTRPDCASGSCFSAEARQVRREKKVIEDKSQSGRRGRSKKGLVIVNTGHGKGKTTAALGVLFRAWGWGWRICVIQFVKHQRGKWGEIRAAERLGIEWHKMGSGFTQPAGDTGEATAKARRGWELAQEKIASGDYDLIVLDEFTYPLNYGWLDRKEVIAWLQEHKPPALHLVITGRDAPPALIEFADLVTDMQKVKHPFDRGVKAQPGIEF